MKNTNPVIEPETWDDLFIIKFGEKKYAELDLHTRRIGDVCYESVYDDNGKLIDINPVNPSELINTCVETDTAEQRQEQLLKNILAKLQVSPDDIANILAEEQK